MGKNTITISTQITNRELKRHNMSNYPANKITGILFQVWIRQQMYRHKHSPGCIKLYKVGNTLIRQIVLYNGEVIETTIRN